MKFRSSAEPDPTPALRVSGRRSGQGRSRRWRRDEEGRPCTVRNEAVNGVLLNEFLREHPQNEA